MIAQTVKAGQVGTTDATQTTLISYTIPTGTDGVWFARAWVSGRRYDASGGGAGSVYAAEILFVGEVNGGSAGDGGNATVTAEHDPGANAWSATMSTSAGNLLVQVTGASSTSIRWHGRLEFEMREQAHSWGG